jgi:ERCC4-type nuclease
MKIVVDSREQRPFPFTRYEADLERAALPTADYSLPGFEDRVGIERKELGDLVGCLMGANRERFEKELRRLSAYDLKAVVVEASMRDVADGLYRSEMKPHAVLQSVLAFQVRYGVPFLWCGDRAGAEYTTFWLLAKYAREIEERMKALTKAQARANAPPSRVDKSAA